MGEDANADGVARRRDLGEPAPRHRRQAEAQVQGAPVDRYHLAGAEPLVDVERAVGVDVHAAIEARAVVSDDAFMELQLDGGKRARAILDAAREVE